MMRPMTISRQPLIAIELALLTLTTSYFFIVVAFFVNGLHRYSYDALWWQQTPAAGDFPFTEPAGLGLMGFVFLLLAILIATIGSVIVPVASVWVTAMIRPHWPALSWQERGLWFASTAAGIVATAIMWSPLGRSIATWVFD